MRTTGRAIAATTLLVASCGSDFDPYYRLTSLRVLAVQSEPVAPATGETTELSALVYTPPGVAVTKRAWSWCPFAGSSRDGYPCLVTEEELAAFGGGAANVPSFDLGSGETASLANAIDPMLLAGVCAGRPGQPKAIDCTGGFPVQVKLVVEAGDAEVTTVRALRLRFAPGDEANANPTIDGLVVVVNEVEQPLADAPEPMLARREEVVVRAQVADAIAESYTGADDDGNPATLREHLSLSWFVESGVIDTKRTSFVDGLVPLADALENRWTPAGTDDYPMSTSQLVVVLRDNRNGVTWRSGTATLESTP